jgi:site-specific recombinase XerD
MWGAQFERDELAKADEAWIERAIYEDLEQKYVEQLDAKEMLSESTKEQYKASCKKFVAFCQEISAHDVLNIRVSAMPARPGIVAQFLHEELVNGASPNTIRRHASAIGFFHRFNEKFDPCEDRLVKAIIYASTKGQRPTSPDEH